MDDVALVGYVSQLHSDDAEHAYFALLTHCAPTDLQKLMQAYEDETDLRVKVKLLEIIWQQRQAETLTFLARALRHQKSEIWKTALDGIVAIGTSEAREVLEVERHRLLAQLDDNATARVEWIDEAIRQVN